MAVDMWYNLYQKQVGWKDMLKLAAKINQNKRSAGLVFGYTESSLL